jgi:predicted nucleotidyltransferase
VCYVHIYIKMLTKRLPSFCERATTSKSCDCDDDTKDLDLVNRYRSDDWRKVKSSDGDDVDDEKIESSKGNIKKKKNKISDESSLILNQLTNQLIRSLRPSKQSELRRRKVFKRVQGFILECFGSERVLVSAFGSVPFGTYLPDGDIDMCVLGDYDVLDSKHWAEQLSAFIARKSREEKKEKMSKTKKKISTIDDDENDDEYLDVNDIVIINANVKLLKCVVDGIVVDVSVNQFGGLSTLAFLEEVNSKIGKNDLFKRSVILVKAWAYYESRVLGAQYALLSTYALKTIIICAIRKKQQSDTTTITNNKRTSFETPLDILRAFFEYVSEFPWETHAVTIFGDVPIQKLHSSSSYEISARDVINKQRRQQKQQQKQQQQRNNTKENDLDDDFVDATLKRYGPDSRPDTKKQQQQQHLMRRRSIGARHLHILDPLCDTNNLGRSVSLGNFARIRAAFRLGAERLKRLEFETLPENINRGFEYFFKVALANRGGKLASFVGDDNDQMSAQKMIITTGVTSPQTLTPTKQRHSRNSSLVGSLSQFHSHSVADDLCLLNRTPQKKDNTDVGDNDINSEKNNAEKIRLMLDDEEKDAHGKRGLFWGRWDSARPPSDLSTAAAAKEEKEEEEKNEILMKFSKSDTSSPAASPPRSDSGDASDSSVEYDDTKSTISYASQSQSSSATTTTSSQTTPHSPLSPLDKYQSSTFKEVTPQVEESKDIITGCLETIHAHLNFGIEMQRIAIEKQNAATISAMVTNSATISQPQHPPQPSSSTPARDCVRFIPPLPPSAHAQQQQQQHHDIPPTTMNWKKIATKSSSANSTPTRFEHLPMTTQVPPLPRTPPPMLTTTSTFFYNPQQQQQQQQQQHEVSMVEAVAWVAVARGSANLKSQDKANNDDVLEIEKESSSVPTSTANVTCNRSAEKEIENNISRSKSDPPLQQAKWGPNKQICLDTLRKVAEKQMPIQTQLRSSNSPPSSVVSSEDQSSGNNEEEGITFDESDVLCAAEMVKISLKGTSYEKKAKGAKKTKGATTKNKLELKAPETSCEKSFPKFGGSSSNTGITANNNNVAGGVKNWASLL